MDSFVVVVAAVVVVVVVAAVVVVVVVVVVVGWLVGLFVYLFCFTSVFLLCCRGISFQFNDSE